MRAWCRGTLVLATVMVLVSGERAARAQSVEVHTDGEATAGVPIDVTVQVEGFGEAEPQVDALDVKGCSVRALGKFPQRSEMVQIINGQRSHRVSVTWNLQYRVVCPKQGQYRVAPVKATGGGRSATSGAATLPVGALEPGEDMQLRLVLPDRPVLLGEEFEADVDWYLSGDVSDQQFQLPLLESADWVQIVPEAQTGRTLTVPVGTGQVELPISQERAELQGKPYTRVRLRVRLIPLKAGTLELPAPRVTARMQVGYTRDGFGFRVPKTKLVSAVGEPGRLVIEDAPAAGRPADYKDAVGAGFSLSVRAGRTVVKVGDPIALEIVVQGEGRLEGLTLPPLAKAGLDPAAFSVPDAMPAGVVSADGKSKTFQVTVRLLSRDVTAIPPLSFSWFDPEKKAYATARSQPVALSVQGGQTISAGDVVSAAPSPPVGAASGAETAGAPASLVGADLALSDPRQTLVPVWGGTGLHGIVAALYGFPLAAFCFGVWRRRTQTRRGASGQVRRALAAVDAALARAEREPASDAAPGIVAALGALRRIAPAGWETSVVEGLEHAGFDPERRAAPVPDALREAARVMARRMADAREASVSAASGAPGAALCVWLVAGALLGLPPTARGAGPQAGPSLDEARRTYEATLSLGARDARLAGFAAAESSFAALVAAHPRCPELLTDWGNAALGAGETGRAVLAYRRALAFDPGSARAWKNLAWLRERAPEWVPRAREASATESLLVWRHLSPQARTLLGAAAFAAMMLLLTPWRGRLGRAQRGGAVVPALVWVMLGVQGLLPDPRDDDGVVTVAEIVVRSADSLGAPPALPQPLPGGTEVDILEERGAFVRVALADDRRGWVPQASVSRVGSR